MIKYHVKEIKMKYTIKEIIDIAIGLEETGNKFYTKCSTKFKNKDIIETFSFLAKEELAHKEIFESFAPEDMDVSGQYNDEYYLYMKSIGGGRVFAKEQDIDKFLSSIDSPEEAIRKALADEKEAILFYSELKPYFQKNDKIIKILDEIIAEERKHVLTLVGLLENMRLL